MPRRTLFRLKQEHEAGAKKSWREIRSRRDIAGRKAVPLPALKVSAKSNPHGVAGAVAGEVREHGFAEVQVVGAGAVNQAMKAIAIARGFFSGQALDLVCIPQFTEIQIDGDQRTALLIRVESRSLPVVLAQDVVTVEVKHEPSEATAILNM